jgi:hypothetical protein
MAGRTDETPPIMRGRTRLDANQARWHRGKEFGHFGSLQSPAKRHASGRVDTVHLKDAFAEIKTDGGNLHDGRLLSCGVIHRRPRQALDAVQ